jgi:hypothetical protein
LCFLRTITSLHFDTMIFHIQDAPESAIDPGPHPDAPDAANDPGTQAAYDVHANSLSSSKYRVRTTYSDITSLIATINCCICPGLRQTRPNFPYWCHCNTCLNPSRHLLDLPVKVRMIVFEVKELDEEMRDLWSHLTRQLSYNPLQERRSLRRQGWSVDLSSYPEPKNTFAHARPRQIIWAKRTVGREERVLFSGSRLLGLFW